MTANTWLEVRVAVQESLQEEAGIFLTELSGRGVVLEDAADSPEAGLAGVRAYFPAADFDPARKAEVQAYFQRLAALGYLVGPLTVQPLEEEDWARAWQVHFTPVKLSRRLVIRPPWGEYEAQEEELVLTIHPGMAFGTGRHPSTWLCLQALEDLLDAAPAQVWQALDVGTGTGILALAAAHWGTKVLAIDIDPEAVAAARENIALNRLQDAVRVEDLPLSAIRQRFDLIMANLTAVDLATLAASLSGRLLPQGRLIISGFLEEDLEGLLERFGRAGLQRRQLYSKDDWMAVILQRP